MWLCEAKSNQNREAHRHLEFLSSKSWKKVILVKATNFRENANWNELNFYPLVLGRIPVLTNWFESPHRNFTSKWSTATSIKRILIYELTRFSAIKTSLLTFLSFYSHHSFHDLVDRNFTLFYRVGSVVAMQSVMSKWFSGTSSEPHKSPTSIRWQRLHGTWEYHYHYHYNYHYT